MLPRQKDKMCMLQGWWAQAQSNVDGLCFLLLMLRADGWKARGEERQKLLCQSYCQGLCQWETSGRITRLVNGTSDTTQIMKQAYKSHDNDHQWADVLMTWLPLDNRNHEYKAVRLVWDVNCLHVAEYILISHHDIDSNQIWSRMLNHMNSFNCFAGLSQKITENN